MPGGRLAHLSDEALVALAARSEERALAELYERFARIAYGLALRVLGDASLAEDAVQDGFMTAWRSAGRFFPERGTARSWLLTLVHRRAVDIVRREDRQRVDRGADPLTGFDVAADEAAWVRLERERVQSALAKLPAAEREAIELSYYGGFTQAQLAERLGQPLGTIKSRTFTGLRRLRSFLSEEAERETSWTMS